MIKNQNPESGLGERTKSLLSGKLPEESTSVIWLDSGHELLIECKKHFVETLKILLGPKTEGNEKKKRQKMKQ